MCTHFQLDLISIDHLIISGGNWIIRMLNFLLEMLNIFRNFDLFLGHAPLTRVVGNVLFTMQSETLLFTGVLILKGSQRAKCRVLDRVFELRMGAACPMSYRAFAVEEIYVSASTALMP